MSVVSSDIDGMQILWQYCMCPDGVGHCHMRQQTNQKRSCAIDYVYTYVERDISCCRNVNSMQT